MQRSFLFLSIRVGSKGVAAEFEEGIFAKFGQRGRGAGFVLLFSKSLRI
jgi:hypothetical protein